MVTFWIVPHHWSATGRNHGFAPGEERNIVILPGIEASITQPFSL
jgi:hypothetical protein